MRKTKDVAYHSLRVLLTLKNLQLNISYLYSCAILFSDINYQLLIKHYILAILDGFGFSDFLKMLNKLLFLKKKKNKPSKRRNRSQ